MIFKQLIELYDLLDSPAASGAGVVEYLRGIDPACDAETYVLEGPKGSTDMVRVRIPGSRGRAAGGEALAPSAVFSGFSRSTPKEMSAEEIRSTIADWAAGALRARQAGFDAVEIIGSAGYLISEFLSPVTNLRTDEYLSLIHI